MLSDCIHCWSTPCECGYEYRHWSESQKQELVNAILIKSIEWKLKEEKEERKKNVKRQSKT